VSQRNFCPGCAPYSLLDDNVAAGQRAAERRVSGVGRDLMKELVVQYLVVIAIIAVLIGLLLPA